MKNFLLSPTPILCAHGNIADLVVTSPAHPERGNFSLFTPIVFNYYLLCGQLLQGWNPNDQGRSCKRKLKTGTMIMDGRLSLMKLMLWNYSLSQPQSALTNSSYSLVFCKKFLLLTAALNINFAEVKTSWSCFEIEVPLQVVLENKIMEEILCTKDLSQPLS